MALGWSAGLPTVTELLLILDRFVEPLLTLLR